MNKKILLYGLPTSVLAIFCALIFSTLFVGMVVWSAVATGWLCYIGIHYINDVDKYENTIESHLDDTEKVIQRLSELANSEILKYNDEIKVLITFLRSYLQQLINYVNEMRDQYQEKTPQ